MNRTIAAVSTPPGKGGIAVIRISGADAVKIADSVFSQNICEVKTHTVHYGFVMSNGEKIDEVLVTVMRAPKTFTREDVVEISTHGGIVTTRRVLEAVIAAGAKMAEPGEFTKRAFLNGRIDLAEAEAVIDVINAENTLSCKNAVSQLSGALSREIDAIRSRLVHVAAQMQVIIDYPDEDLADITPAEIRDVCRDCLRASQLLLKTADSGAIIRDGIRAAIVGKPNVGKSSLLNALARYDRAIVTDIAGTTRDIIEEQISLDGIPIVLIDTAGIHHTEDAVEKIGVEKSRQSINDADLVLAVIDGSRETDEEDLEILNSTRGFNRIILVSKSDIAAPHREIKADGSTVIEISAVTGDGIDRLRGEISRMYGMGDIEKSSGAVITNMRHQTALLEAEKALKRAVGALDNKIPTDIVSIDINEAISALGEITGETVTEAVVQDIFHSFCVGK